MNKKNSLVDFGKAGWGVIIFCMAMFYFFVGFCTDGNNVSAPAAAAHLGEKRLFRFDRCCVLYCYESVST